MGLGHIRACQFPIKKDSPPELQVLTAVRGCGANVNMSSWFTRKAGTLKFLCEISQFLNLGSIIFLLKKNHTTKAKLSPSLSQSQPASCQCTTLTLVMTYDTNQLPFPLFFLLTYFPLVFSNPFLLTTHPSFLC
jgi:hypothetical protein